MSTLSLTQRHEASHIQSVSAADKDPERHQKQQQQDGKQPPSPPPPPPTTTTTTANKPQGNQALLFLQLLFACNPTWVDSLLILIGTISGLAAGVPFPLMGILFGELVDDMNGASCSAQSDPTAAISSFEPAVNRRVLQLVYISCAAFALIYTYLLCWSIAGQRLTQRLRERYFASLLRQELAFFDGQQGSEESTSSGANSAGQVSARFHADIQAVQAGASEKVGIFLASISFFVSAFGVAFSRQARLAGILVSIVPAYLIMGFVCGGFTSRFTTRVSNAAAQAATVASEALSRVAIVQVFGAGPRLEAKFAGYMVDARKDGIKKAIVSAVQAGLLYFIAFSANALAFWQGSIKIADALAGNGGGATVGQIYTVIFLIVDGKCT